MSIVRSRELSQFGSFIYIDNDSQKIGIATETTPFVGIGTANPTVKFHVVGDTNLDGNVNITNGNIEAPSYTLNGNPLVDVTILQWNYASNGTDIYRLQGNVGLGTSVFTERLTVDGNVSAGQFISTVTETSPLVVSSTNQVFNLNASLLAGKTPPDGDIVGTTGTQTLTNKTLTNPVISSISNSGTLTLPTGTGTLIRTGSVGLVTSGMIADLSIINANVATNAGITYSKLSLTNSIVNADIATNAGITYGKLSLTGSITNADIASNAGISVSKLSTNTISGITLGNNLATLTFGTYLTGTSYNGSVARTIGINASTSGDSNIVARDGSGNFTAGTITASSFTSTGDLSIRNINSTGIVTATDFNSASDQNLKENIQTVENALETVGSLRGVSFDWKETGKGSYGVIAQELEKVLPQLVNDGEIKSVNYNGLIGVLIEAVKELSQEVEELKKKVF